MFVELLHFVETEGIIDGVNAYEAIRFPYKSQKGKNEIVPHVIVPNTAKLLLSSLETIKINL